MKRTCAITLQTVFTQRLIIEADSSYEAAIQVALCGHRGDYDLPGWTEHDWERGRLTYNGGATTAQECVWFSPACLPLVAKQTAMFG